MSDIPEIAVIDTHALIWWLTGTVRKLGRRARAFVDRVDDGRAVACIPTMCLLELSEAIHSGGVTLSLPFDRLMQRLESTPSRYSLVPLHASIVARAHSLFAIPERGDRIITATALDLDLPLFTRDAEIARAAAVQVLW